MEPRTNQPARSNHPTVHAAPLPRRRCGGCAGFTLFEALIALAVVAVTMTAIGSLVAFNLRSTARLDERVTLAETARSLLASLTQRDAGSGTVSAGESNGLRWQARSALRPDLAASPAAPWMPQSVVVSVQNAAGRRVEVETIRLVRAPRPER